MESVPEPRPIVRGERVFLRASERSDLPAFVRWLNDADVLRNLAGRPPMSAAAEAQWYDRMLAAQGTTGYHFVVHIMSLLREAWLRRPRRGPEPD